jgi:hypothetical protein
VPHARLQAVHTSAEEVVAAAAGVEAVAVEADRDS